MPKEYQETVVCPLFCVPYFVFYFGLLFNAHHTLESRKAMSKTSTKAATITIDGTQYALDNLTENARAQIVNLRVTDQEIARLQTQLAIAQTARAAYAQALTAQLPAAADAKQAQ